MKRTSLAITCTCIMVAILSPLVSGIYFADRLVETSESFEFQISDLQQENEGLRQEIEQLEKENEEPISPYLMESFLVTELGWYLHDSRDPVNYSRNKFTSKNI